MSSIMNTRLLQYIESNSLLVEEQNGFRKSRSCIEHIFVMSSVIRARITDKKATYCCFVDFAKAFDFVNRDLLLAALRNVGINGKFLSMIQCMYSKTEAAIKINDKLTDWFQTESGVRQGQNDSSTIFSIFINSLSSQIKSTNVGVKYGDILISILLYADDIILLAETEEEMQIMLNELQTWCIKWRMSG